MTDVQDLEHRRALKRPLGILTLILQISYQDYYDSWIPLSCREWIRTSQMKYLMFFGVWDATFVECIYNEYFILYWQTWELRVEQLVMRHVKLICWYRLGRTEKGIGNPPPCGIFTEDYVGLVQKIISPSRLKPFLNTTSSREWGDDVFNRRVLRGVWDRSVCVLTKPLLSSALVILICVCNDNINVWSCKKQAHWEGGREVGGVW